MICCVNLLMIDNSLNIRIFLNELRMTHHYDCNACAWFGVLIAFCKSKMRTYRKQKASKLIDEKDDTLVVAFHSCTMIETNVNAVNWSTNHSNRLNDCIQRTIFNHLTHIFNKLQRRIARSWRIQNAIEQRCEDIEESYQIKERWDWAKRWWNKRISFT